MLTTMTCATRDITRQDDKDCQCCGAAAQTTLAQITLQSNVTLASISQCLVALAVGCAGRSSAASLQHLLLRPHCRSV